MPRDTVLDSSPSSVHCTLVDVTLGVQPLHCVAHEIESDRLGEHCTPTSTALDRPNQVCFLVVEAMTELDFVPSATVAVEASSSVLQLYEIEEDASAGEPRGVRSLFPSDDSPQLSRLSPCSSLVVEPLSSSRDICGERNAS